MKRSTGLLACSILLLAGATVIAQTFHGGLRGAVREAGGVIPGASVVLINEATNVSRSTTTNTTGEYAFVNVDPGTYTTRVSMQGFKTIESKGIRIGTQQFVTLDFTMEVGQLQEAITVEGQASALETSNASVGSTLDQATLQTLPTAGRNAFYLAITTPNVIPTGDPQFVRQQDQTNSSLLSLAGAPRRTNNYTLDGVSIVDLRNRATFIPSIEAVEEVKVQVSTYDAEMGRTGGGVFNTTGKSGTNEWRGSALYQNRPRKAAALPFFQQRQCDAGAVASCAKPDTYFHLYGGSFGGPIIKNKTFFWATTEGYRTKTTRNSTVTVPTSAELDGNFSASGVTIYDPLTTRVVGGQIIRDPFPGNVIPSARINPVARALRQYWPTSGGSSTAELVDVADQATGKLDHRWSDNFHSSLMYAWYDSVEPEARFLGKLGGGVSPASKLGDNPADPAEGALYRTVHVVALNNTITPNPSTVVHLRGGYTTFKDNDVPNAFDPGTLGFSQTFIGQISRKKFSDFDIGSWGSDQFGDTFGDRDPQDTKYYSIDANASVSRLVGRHTVKLGASFRKIGMKNTSFGSSSGRFTFNGLFSAADPINAPRRAQNELADFLLGYPSSGNITVATPNDFFIDYYAGYVQDDFRVNSNLTLNFGLRYEFEQGLQEKNDAFTVGFDRDRAYPVQVPGLNLRGGLMYAGVDGYPTHQSDPSKTKFAPRVGFAWSANTETVIRGGYGIFYAPLYYAFPTESNLGARGFTATTTYVASTDGNLTPANTMTNPYPAGIEQPRGSADGLRTGAGGTVHFVDQFRKSPYVQQFSLDVQRTLPGDLVVGVGYLGARGTNFSVGGQNSGIVNINQLDPRHQALGAALLEAVPNPMFGNPAAFGQFGRQATITRGQLLRPYPQFGDVLAHQVSAGKTRYHSAILRLERRIRNGWGARVNYTWASSKDNLFGDANFFSGGVNQALNNYDLDREYSEGLLSTPHRLNVSGTWELPFGKGKTWLSEPGIARTLFGGWSITVVGTYQSGFPVNVTQSVNNTGLLGGQQRPNLGSVDPKTSGGTIDRLNNWFATGAWTQAPAFTLGNAPRTDARARTPFKDNTDVAFQKIEPLGGRRTLMIRAEIINFFNDANLRGPNTSFGSANFGRVLTVAGFPRMLQVTVRVGF
jgi:hypothetical protein